MVDASVSLHELCERIGEEISVSFQDSLWIRAEISELHENDGNAYFDFVEKNDSKIVSKMHGVGWKNVYPMLRMCFESATGERLRSGIKVLIFCAVEFHPVYGLSLLVLDIDPSFTVGDMAIQRAEIVRQLKEDGIFDLNKLIELPQLTQRIAVISSATAAGYGDFVHQLKNNSRKIVFYTKLFPAVMQGEKTVKSIVSALDKIYAQKEKFDLVVIIRGGGATADLSSFDDYELAMNCAQYPLPIVAGIGHLRDECVLDLVANRSLKTPTAVAEFLISNMIQNLDSVLDLEQNLRYLGLSWVEMKKSELQRLLFNTHQIAKNFVSVKQVEVETLRSKLLEKGRFYVSKKMTDLLLMCKDLSLYSPTEMQKHGFVMVAKNGKRVFKSLELEVGDEISIYFEDGKKNAHIR